MQGIYRIQLGDVCYEYKNVITNSGRLGLLRAIAGQRVGWAASVIAGVGATTATANDTGLEFQVAGGDINAAIVDPVNEKLYFKATLPLEDELTIYELGCYASNTLSTQKTESGGGSIMALITSDSLWTDVDGTHGTDTVNNRVGKDSISYSITASDTVIGQLAFINDLSFIPTNASFRLAYYSNNLADLIVRFKVDDSNYFAYDGWSVTNGYKIGSALKSDFVATGSPSWSQIQTIEFEATATGSTGTLSLDAIRYELPLSNESDLLSRVVITPKQKLPGVPLDIEYLLEL
jgi:hypothetical protein